jgi:hypothetical protein
MQKMSGMFQDRIRSSESRGEIAALLLWSSGQQGRGVFAEPQVQADVETE